MSQGKQSRRTDLSRPDVPGNITPTAEFNFCADAFAASRVLALTSPNPQTTMPPAPPHSASETRRELPGYSPHLSRQLNLTLLPLDITTQHLLTPTTFNKYSSAPLKDESPLAEWVHAFLAKTFTKTNEKAGALSLHDPLAVWCAIKRHTEGAGWRIDKARDIRIEATGQWTRGFCVVDRRGYREKSDDDPDIDKHVSGDAGGWFSTKRGNRVNILTGTPVMQGNRFGEVLCERLFGPVKA